MDTPDNGRDDGGRFAAGNRCGKGRPKGLGYELQRAAQEAVTPEHIQAIIRKATMLALQGNLPAMRLVLERTCGRAPEASAQGTPIEIALPTMGTAAECNRALQIVSEGIVAGSVDATNAKLLLDVIQTRLKAIEVQDLERRLTELEKAAAITDEPGTSRWRP